MYLCVRPSVCPSIHLLLALYLLFLKNTKDALGRSQRPHPTASLHPNGPEVPLMLGREAHFSHNSTAPPSISAVQGWQAWGSAWYLGDKNEGCTYGSHLLRKHVRVILGSGSKTVMPRDCLNCCSTQIKRLPVYEAGVRPSAKAPRPIDRGRAKGHLHIPGS